MSNGKRTRSLDNIKQRIADMKSKIDETEERENYAKAELVKALSRQLANETDSKSLSNKVGTVKAKLLGLHGKHEDVANQLDENSTRSEVSESTRKQLEAKEEEGFEKSQELESTSKLVKFDKDEKESKYKEAVLREKVLESDLKRVEEKVSKATEQATELQDELDKMAIKTSDRENRVNELSETEDDSKEKINFLNDQIKQLTSLEEEKSAKQKTAERYIDRLTKDLKIAEDNFNDMQKQLDELDDIPD